MFLYAFKLLTRNLKIKVQKRQAKRIYSYTTKHQREKRFEFFKYFGRTSRP